MADLPDGVPEGSLIAGVITITYFLTPSGDPIVNTNISCPDESRPMPTYFEAVAMHGMAQDSINQIYQGSSES